MAVTNTFTPIANSCQTILGSTVDLENTLPITRRNDVSTTMNHLRNVLPATIPPNGGEVKLQYFGIGIGGRIFGNSKTSPAPVSALNMNLYTGIPMRVVMASQDLSSADMKQYRHRVPFTKNGIQYVAYWYKVISFADTSVQYTRTDPTTGETAPYVIDASYLNPTPPTIDANKQVIDPASGIDVGVATLFGVTGAEVLEAINILYDGDTDLAVISEFGVFSGADIQNTVQTVSGAQLTYTEAAMLQLCQHYTWNGSSAGFSSSQVNGGFKFSSSSIILS